MATRFQLKRSAVGGVVPTTSDISNAELAVNLSDRKLYTSDGSIVFEVGANIVNLSVTSNATLNAIVANGTLGSAGQVLHSNSTGIYWAADDAGVTSVASGNGLTGGPITSTGTVSILANSGIIANSTGAFVNSAYIATIAANSATYANSSISNTFTVGTSVYFVSNGNVGIGNTTPNHKLRIEGDISLSGGLHANNSFGSNGQVLTSNGSTVYWSTSESGGSNFIAYDDRGDLRSIDGPSTSIVIIDGLGTFQWEFGSTEPDDDETCFVTDTGAWLLSSVSWDVAAAYWYPDIDYSSTKLYGTAQCSLTSLALLTGASFTTTILGAQIGDSVLVNPPNTLDSVASGGRLGYYAWVSNENTVTIRVTNSSNGTATVSTNVTGPSNLWQVIVFKGF